MVQFIFPLEKTKKCAKNHIKTIFKCKYLIDSILGNFENKEFYLKQLDSADEFILLSIGISKKRAGALKNYYLVFCTNTKTIQENTLSKAKLKKFIKKIQGSDFSWDNSLYFENIETKQDADCMPRKLNTLLYDGVKTIKLNELMFSQCCRCLVFLVCSQLKKPSIYCGFCKKPTEYYPYDIKGNIFHQIFSLSHKHPKEACCMTCKNDTVIVSPELTIRSSKFQFEISWCPQCGYLTEKSLSKSKQSSNNMLLEA